MTNEKNENGRPRYEPDYIYEGSFDYKWGIIIFLLVIIAAVLLS